MSKQKKHHAVTGRWRPSSQMLLFILVLLSFPLLSYRFLIETRDFLIEGQSLAQEQLAQGIVTLFQGRADLLGDLPFLDSQQVVFSHPLSGKVKVDGFTNEWLDFQLFANHFITDEETDGYSLLLGEFEDRIYGLVRIQDNVTVLRDKDNRQLNSSDHLRLSLPDRRGNERRLVISAIKPGLMEVWYVQEDWATPLYSNPSSTFIIQAYMRPLVSGYLVEFTLPRYFLNERQEFGLAVADVDSDDGSMRHLKTLVSSDTNVESHFNLLAMRSPEANKILASLDRSNSQIIIYDDQLRVRASVGKLTNTKNDIVNANGIVDRLKQELNKVLDWFVAIPVLLNSSQEASQEREVLTKALSKEFSNGRWHRSAGEEILAVAAPITDQEGTVLGAVMIKKSTADILKLQRQAMENIALASFATLMVILIVLLGFSWRQAYRVQRLGREAQQIVDPVGRLRADHINSDINSGDEIGALARSFSDVVQRLHDHQQFMSTMPRTLRHEINNPLNASMTSLENLQHHGVETEQGRYVNIAQRGLVKISAIVEKLADAANLEESLQEDELELTNLVHLTETYVSHQYQVHKTTGQDIVFVCKDTNIDVAAVDYRIEQLLDKILDNARDFRHEGTPIIVRLYQDNMDCYLEVENEGPHISEALHGTLFSSMVSGRQEGSGQAHFGLGLYIARMIALFHGGELTAYNITNPGGVQFRVRFPLWLG